MTNAQGVNVQVENDAESTHKLVRVGIQYSRNFCPVCLKIAKTDHETKHIKTDCRFCGLHKEVFGIQN
jgi:hypothetical protein